MIALFAEESLKARYLPRLPMGCSHRTRSPS